MAKKYFFFILCIQIACKRTQILSDQKMIDIITDICIAKNLSEYKFNNIPYYTLEEIYQIHNTKAQIFTQSYKYYIKKKKMDNILEGAKKKLIKKLQH